MKYVLAVIVIILLCGCVGENGVKIICDESFKCPLEAIESNGMNVKEEMAQSFSCITRAGEQDIVIVSDYNLITLLYPDKTNYYIKFAADSIVIAYSKSLNEKWYEMEDVKIGIMNPNTSACGYQTLMVLKLAENYYGDDSILYNFICKNTKIKDEGTIIVPETLEVNEKVTVETSFSDLINDLEEVDCIFVYRSIAEEKNLKFLELPDQINLGNARYRIMYNDVKVTLFGNVTIAGNPIVYGLSLLSTKAEAIRLVEFILSSRGKEILEESDLIPLNPPLTDNINNVPHSLRDYLEEEGPAVSKPV